jgi:MFS family permease
MSPSASTPHATSANPQRSVLLRIAPFVLVVFFVYLTVGIPLAALPLQVHDILGFDTLTIGVVIGAQSLATLVTRQFAGTLCDHRGAKFVMLLGTGGCILAGAVYAVSALPAFNPYASLGVLFVARLLSGLAESLAMTGALAGGIGLVGPQNTGKVMVWVGIGMYAAIGFGAPIGIRLMEYRGIAGGFAAVAAGIVICSAVATLIGAFAKNVERHHGERLPFSRVVGRVAPFGAGLALATIAFGAIGAFAALDFQSKGWSGAGLALTAFGIAYVFTRMIFGGWPDRFGGARVAAWSLVIECLGQIILWLAPVPEVALVGAILTGVGFSLVFPSLGIEAVKHVTPANRGAALGAYVAFFDIGFGVSGPITGFIAGTLGYPWVFAAGAVCAAAGLLAARLAARGSAAPVVIA